MARLPAVYPPGTQVPGTVYRIVKELARGGMGSVYDVEDLSIGKHYVLKTLVAELVGREEIARRMTAEARVLARLSHPNIVDVITAGVTQDEHGMPYFVMERLDGESLRGVLAKRGPLELAAACRIGIDLLDALEHAHENGVVHRDVKPDNIFLHRGTQGAPVTKLLDFGIMRLTDSPLDQTRQRFIGTLPYASPEQILMQKITPATDLFAAGLVLYEMVAGRGPWHDKGGGLPRADAHANEAAPPLSQWVQVPEAYERVVMAALAKDPKARPRDAFTFAAELRKVQQGSGRSGSSTRAPTAVAPLSMMIAPRQADALAALVPAPGPAGEGLRAFARTIAGDERAALETRHEGAAVAPQPKQPFAATLKLAEAAAARASVGVDRHALTLSVLPEPPPGHPSHDTQPVGALAARLPLQGATLRSRMGATLASSARVAVPPVILGTEPEEAPTWTPESDRRPRRAAWVLGGAALATAVAIGVVGWRAVRLVPSKSAEAASVAASVPPVPAPAESEYTLPPVEAPSSPAIVVPASSASALAAPKASATGAGKSRHGIELAPNRSTTKPAEAQPVEPKPAPAGTRPATSPGVDF